MMTDTDTETRTPSPARSRPVFSTEDFALLRTAVLSYIKQKEHSPAAVKCPNLSPRLGRLG